MIVLILNLTETNSETHGNENIFALDIVDNAIKVVVFLIKILKMMSQLGSKSIFIQKLTTRNRFDSIFGATRVIHCSRFDNTNENL